MPPIDNDFDDLTFDIDEWVRDLPEPTWLLVADPSALARAMLRWEEIRRRLDAIEQRITEAVLELGETVVVGNVRARYGHGRRSYDYKEAALGCEPPDDLVEEYTAPRVDWRRLALEGLELVREDIPFTQADPWVSLRLEHVD